MTKRQWAIVQGLALTTFLMLWALGAGVLGITFFVPGKVAPTRVAQAAVASSTPSPTPSAVRSPTATFTPSPTHTLAPTPTPLPTRTPPPTRTPWPSATPSPTATVPPNPVVVPPLPTFVLNGATPEPVLPLPSPVPTIPVAPNTINILLLGSDRRPHWSEWHTDVVQLVSIQPDRAAVTILSIPRDFYIYIPGFWMSRVNSVDYYGEEYNYPGGGPALLRDTLLYNLGVRVDHTVRTDFDGLIGIVDTLGGVDIPVHCRLSDHWPYPDENGEYPILTLEPGVHHMDGETALWYARSRMTTSVFSRERRQQQVLQAIWHKIRDTGVLTQIPALWEQMREMVVTDMNLAAVSDLARVAFLLQEQNIRFYSIGADIVIGWTTPEGGWVFLPRWEAIEPVVAEVMAPIPQARLARTFTTVEVWNGTSNADWEHLAADRLMRAGFPAVVGESDRRDYALTQLTVYSEHAKGTGVEYLQQMFGIPDDRVVYDARGSTSFGFRLIIGAHYQTCH